MTLPPRGLGAEWVVEALGCDAERLRDVGALRGLADDLIVSLALRPVAPAQWHRFPGPGGVTGFVLLAESHFAVHTFPEHGSLCLNLFCCVPRPEWDWAEGLMRHMGARHVRARRLDREYTGWVEDAGALALAPAESNAHASP